MDPERHRRKKSIANAGWRAAQLPLSYVGYGMQPLSQERKQENIDKRPSFLVLQRWFPGWTRSRLRRKATRLERTFARKRFVSVLNLAVFFMLLWEMWSIVKRDGDLDLPNEVLRSMKIEDLPYPLNLVVQVHRKNISVPTETTSQQRPGYARIQAGTFRNKYPSRDIAGTDTFDGIFVITSDKCQGQWEEFQKAANRIQLMYSKWPMADSRHISLSDPPIPIAPELQQQLSKATRTTNSMLKRQISYLDAHRRLWQHIVRTGKQRVLIIDDSLLPNERLRKSLPPLMTNIDQESVARQTPWHYLFLRRQKLLPSARESMWTMNPVYNHAVVVASTSHGAGAYVLSISGARFLLERVRLYRAPLDVEVGLLQRDFPGEFNALSACNNDRVQPFCPEIVEEIRTIALRHGLDCAWRRVQERRTASEFTKYFNMRSIQS